MVSAIASLLISVVASGGFVTPRFVITPGGYVWPIGDLFHAPMNTPHPQGGRVIAAAGNAAQTAYLLGHDRNIEIFIYGVNDHGNTMNETDAPRELAQAGALKMWAFDDGQFLVQSDAKKAAWVFDPVKYWRTVEYSDALASLTPYGQGAVQLLGAKDSGTVAVLSDPMPVDPAQPTAKSAEPKKKPKRVTSFVYYPVATEADVAAIVSPPDKDSVISVVLPDGLKASGICPTVTPGIIVLDTGRRAFVYSLAEKKLVSEIITNGAVSATLAFESNQCYAITFGTGERPQISRLALTEVASTGK